MFAGATGLLLQVGCGGCGDDDETIDARMNPDSAPTPDTLDPPDAEEPDAPPPSTRAGQVALTEVRIVDADGAAVGLRGAAVSIEFQDLTTFVPSSIAYDDRDALGNGCLVQVFDNSLTPPVVPATLADEGDVTISGALMTFNAPCVFNGTLGRYICPQGQGALAGTTTQLLNADTGDGQATIQGAAGTFAPNLAGQYIAFPSGFDQGANAAIFTPTQYFPVLGQVSTTTVVIAVGLADANVAPEVVGAAGAATGTYSALAGEGPVPGGTADFLGDDTDGDVTAAMTGGDLVDDFSSALVPSGEGIDLDDASEDPTDATLDGSAITFSCSGTGGSCGAMSGETLEILAVSGKTTDTVPGGTDGSYIMKAPTTKWATWSCAALAGTSLTIPAGAMAAITSVPIERIEFRVFRMSAAINTNDTPPPNRTNVVMGHGVVGHTTPP